VVISGICGVIMQRRYVAVRRDEGPIDLRQIADCADPVIVPT
jgi:hypothetical protein